MGVVAFVIVLAFSTSGSEETTTTVSDCSVTDGAWLSKSYPCACGTSNCTQSDQICTALSNSCQALDGYGLLGIGNCVPNHPQWFKYGARTLSECQRECMSTSACIAFDTDRYTCRIRFASN